MPARLLATLGFVVGLLAIGSTPALAESTKMSWFVGGHELTKGEAATFASTAALDTAITINPPSTGVKIKCSGYSPGKGELQGAEEMSQSESEKFEGCSEEAPVNCKLQQSAIALTSTLFLLDLHNPLDTHFIRVLHHPRSGVALATITLEGSTCAVAGEKPLSGSFTLAAPNIESEESAQNLEGLGSTENNSMELAGAKAYLEGGKTLLRLASGSKWSFRP